MVVCLHAFKLFSRVQGYREVKSSRTAKPCLYVCKDVPDWLHKSERGNLWPQQDTVPHQITAINHTPLCLSNSWLSHSFPTVFICYNINNKCIQQMLIVKLSLYLLSVYHEGNRELLALSDIFYCSNQDFSFLFVCQFINCCLTQQTKPCEKKTRCNCKSRLLQMHFVEDKKRSKLFKSVDVISVH